jgi:hypothetical protein
MKSSTYICASCKSFATKRCRVLYEQSSAVSDTGGGSFREFGYRARPPELTSRLFPAVLIGSGCLAFLQVLGSGLQGGGTIVLLLAAALIYLGMWILNRRKLAIPRFKEAMERYERSWICLDCAHVFWVNV